MDDNDEIQNIIQKLQNEIQELSKNKRKIVRKFANKAYYDRKKDEHKTFCECCNKSISKYYFTHHTKTASHIALSNS